MPLALIGVAAALGLYLWGPAALALQPAPGGMLAGLCAGLWLGLLVSRSLLGHSRAEQLEDQLRQNFEALFDSAPVPMSHSFLGSDGLPGQITWNRSWFEVFGYAPEQVQGHPALSFNFFIDASQRQDFVRRAIEGDQGYTAELRLRSANGSVRRALVSGRVIEVHGRAMLLSSFLDVSEQRRLESARIESELSLHEFAEMVESANDAMMLVEGYRIVECNPATLRLYQLDRASLVGKYPSELSPDVQEDGWLTHAQAKAHMKAALAGEAQRFLWRHRRADGSEFVAEVALNPARSVECAGQAPRRRFVAVIRDVSVERQAMAALQDSELRFRQLFELAPVALALATPDGLLSAVNRQWVQLLGYERSEVRRIDDWWQLAFPDSEYRQHALRAWRQGLDRINREGGELYPTEFLVRCKNGSQRNLLVGGAWVGSDLLASFHDVTEQRAAQAQLEALNASLESRVAERTEALSAALEHLRGTQAELVRSEKLAGLGSLVAGIAHELNTPIGNAVMVASTQSGNLKSFDAAVAQGLRRSALARFISESREAGAVLERNLHRAAELISSFKQVAVDQSSYQRRPFELDEVLHELRLTLSPTLRRSQVELIEDVRAGLDMDSYPGPLTQVLMNLVNNAVLHGFEGRMGGRVRITGRALHGDRVRITIVDNGAGIAAEHLPRLFDPFFTTKLGRGGSGLGLHIVYSLVTELLGGTVSIRSRVGVGSVVRLKLPLRAPQASTAS